MQVRRTDKEVDDTVCVNNGGIMDDDLNSLYLELGKEYYEGAFEDPLPQLLPLFDRITQLKNREKQLHKVMFCPKCGTKLEAEVFFCPKCGHKIQK